MKKMTLLLGMGFSIVGLTSLKLPAQAPFSVGYRFNSVTINSGTNDPTPVPTFPGIIFGSFHAVGYTGNPTGSARFTWRSNELGGIDGDDNFADFTGDLNEGKYFEVTLAPEASYALNLDAITFAVRRSPTGIRSYAVRSSLDDFAANLPAIINTGNTNLGVAPDNSFQWLFDGTSTLNDQVGSQMVFGGDFDALTSPITFRFYGWNAEMSDGTFGIDNVYFNGSVKMVPESGTSALFEFGAMLFGVLRCRELKFWKGTRT